MASGGFDSATTILKGGGEKVSFGGTGINTSITGGGTEIVAGGIASGTVVSSGGTLDVLAGGTATAPNLLSGGTAIVGGTLVIENQTVTVGSNSIRLSSGGKLELENGSVTGPLRVVKGATVDALIGTNVLSGSSGLQIVNAGIMEVESGALLTLAGIVNSGTLMINGDEIQFVGPISGGTTVIGNGVLSIQHSSSENVTFLSAGTGALVLDANYTGKVTSFGGNISQLIEFVLVASAGATVSYTSKSTDSGILDVISGGHTVATVNMVGHYTTADFHTSSFLGALTVTDPEVVEQKSGNASATIASGTVLEVNVPNSGKVTFAGPNGTLWLDKPSTFTGKLADFTAQDSIDLPNIPFGVHTTLGYSEDSSDTGGILSVKNGLHTTSIALLGTCIAGSFVAAADGHGGTLVTEAQPHEQTLLAHPRA